MDHEHDRRSTSTAPEGVTQASSQQAPGKGTVETSTHAEAEQPSAGPILRAGAWEADSGFMDAIGMTAGSGVLRRYSGDAAGAVTAPADANAEVARTGPGEETSASQPGSEVPGEDVANAFSGPAQPVDQQAAAAVGAVTGQDVSGARVHDNPGANQLAASLGTPAVTLGADIAVAGGANINSEGNEILAHELAHVAQQGGAAAAG
ncbi:MAG: DUF4157 domain-containing protein, partial [Actinobacteria bacterium]